MALNIPFDNSLARPGSGFFTPQMPIPVKAPHLARPCDAQPEHEAWKLPLKEDEVDQATFCGT